MGETGRKNVLNVFTLQSQKTENMRLWNIVLFIWISVTAWPQDSIVPIRKNTVKKAAMSLSQSLEENQPDEDVAANYVILAKELNQQGQYQRAENYLNSARHIFQKTQNKEREAYIFRELAKTQEAQKKYNEAKINFNNATKLSVNDTFKVLNFNDYQRLLNISNPISQSQFIQQNIDILGELPDKEEQAVAFQQMAEVNMSLDNREEALTNLQQAMEVVQDKPLEAVKVQREIANVYVADNQYEKATASLKDAYDLAIQEGHTLEAKQSLEMLVEQYRKGNKNTQALDIYADFMARLEPMIKADSTLIDEQYFEVHETRIAQLEKERELKDELIQKQDIINTVLVISIILIFLFLLFSIRAWYSINKRNKQIALQSLRREMNPHFIFNSLNSVNQFIAQNNELEANRYLSSYSRLMRNIMENSNKDFTPLSKELEQLKEYLELEHMRFKDKFTYLIDIDPILDTEAVYIPNMLIQPQLENAIWHGLRYKDINGLLTLTVKQQQQQICITIEDNGIGLKQSQELKTKHQKEHKSRGLTNTRERINLLNSLYNTHITIQVTDKNGGDNGVIVQICFPLKTVK